MDLLQRAVATNVAWCASVCPGDRGAGGVWVTSGPPLPFFPDAVTTRPGVSAARLAEVTQERAPCSVKDSFADVDLTGAGFAELFTARWIGRPAASAEVPAGWRALTDRPDVDRWSAWAGVPHLAGAGLLGGDSVVLAREASGEPAAGCVATVAAGAVGMSNVVAPSVGTWRQLLGVVAARWPALPVVGYERGADLAAARGAGFADLGPVRVWARS